MYCFLFVLLSVSIEPTQEQIHKYSNHTFTSILHSTARIIQDYNTHTIFII